jgi:carboxylesterase type B
LWELIAEELGLAFVEGNATAFNLSAAEAQLENALLNAPAPTPDPQETEDCLFLDVFVPKKIFDNRNNNTGRKAAVLLW